MSHALDGCRAKLARAEEHLDALSADIKSTLEADAYTFRTEFDEADQSTVAFLKEPQQLPVEWGVRLGDVIHNTRSALDHLVHQLVLLDSGTPHDAHQFPIVDGPNDWIRRVQKSPKGRRGLLDFVDPAHVATIQALQPYVPATGLPRLALLRDFSNVDKHRVIHAARTIFTDTPTITAHLALPTTISDIRALPPDTPIEDGTEIVRFRSHTDIVFPQAPAGQATGIWIPAPVQDLTVIGPPDNSEMNVDIKLPAATVFGAPGVAYSRGREFRHAIADARRILESFAAVFP